MQNYIEKSDRVSLPAPTGGVVSGQGVMFSALFGVAVTTAAAGVVTPFQTEGVLSLPKLAGEAWIVGEPVYWDTAAGVATIASINAENSEVLNSKIGCALAVIPTGFPTGTVRLNGTV